MSNPSNCGCSCATPETINIPGPSGAGIQQVLQGSGAPSEDPEDTTLPFIYIDRDTGVMYFWNTVTLTWQ